MPDPQASVQIKIGPHNCEKGAEFSGLRAEGQLPIAERCAQELEKITKRPHHAHIDQDPDYHVGSTIRIVEGFPEALQQCADGVTYEGWLESNFEKAKLCAASLTRITGKPHEAFRTQFNWTRRNFYTVMEISVVSNRTVASSQ